MMCNEDGDIVFVMDVSTTMGPFLDKLARDKDRLLLGGG